MKHLANKLNHLRKQLQTEQRHYSLLDFKYAQKSRMGLLRGYMSMLMGRIIYEGDYRPLILGKNIDYHMEEGSAIILTGENKILS